MIEQKPWLSIVVPAYNAERYLEACIDSIDPQNHRDVQVVLVDDGSTDSTPFLCDSIASRHSNVDVIHKQNGGLPSARNAGYSFVKGDWTWFVDSDDMISPRAAEFLKPLVSTTNSDAVMIGFLLFDDGEKPNWPLQRTVQPTRVEAAELIRGLYQGLYQHFTCSFVFRSDTLQRECGCRKPFREEFSLYEDVVATEEYLRRINCVDVIPEKIYGYRQLNSSMTHKRSSKAAKSGFNAVLDLQRYKVSPDVAADKMRMEVSLLFSAYKLIEEDEGSRKLKQCFRGEIRQRVSVLGVGSLGLPRLFRFILMETRLLDALINWRSRA